jgi:hypothetical protein
MLSTLARSPHACTSDAGRVLLHERSKTYSRVHSNAWVCPVLTSNPKASPDAKCHHRAPHLATYRSFYDTSILSLYFVAVSLPVQKLGLMPCAIAEDHPQRPRLGPPPFLQLPHSDRVRRREQHHHLPRVV